MISDLLNLSATPVSLVFIGVTLLLICLFVGQVCKFILVFTELGIYLYHGIKAIIVKVILFVKKRTDR